MPTHGFSIEVEWSEWFVLNVISPAGWAIGATNTAETTHNAAMSTFQETGPSVTSRLTPQWPNAKGRSCMDSHSRPSLIELPFRECVTSLNILPSLAEIIARMWLLRSIDDLSVIFLTQ
jgi:hypothetical protein